MVKDPAKLNVARFQRISSFLEVVVGLLLGFFLSSSMQRPWIEKLEMPTGRYIYIYTCITRMKLLEGSSSVFW